ncbi:hypothetical protein ABZ192_25905 [Streptomyces sp. NPDC006235]|uniref:hypothetical protein n=1 Tax=Streptomyces sp. NPDC006235 TaxID=3156736 RepID=UPI0033BAEEE6
MTTGTGFDVRRIGGRIGAEILGVDLSGRSPAARRTGYGASARAAPRSPGAAARTHAPGGSARTRGRDAVQTARPPARP